MGNTNTPTYAKTKTSPAVKGMGEVVCGITYVSKYRSNEQVKMERSCLSGQ